MGRDRFSQRMVTIRIRKGDQSQERYGRSLEGQQPARHAGPLKVDQS